MGLHPNLEEAMKLAVRETVLFITQRFPKLSREEAYMIASVTVDYHVTQVVDGTKGSCERVCGPGESLHPVPALLFRMASRKISCVSSREKRLRAAFSSSAHRAPDRH
jgi:hypothetical protein